MRQLPDAQVSRYHPALVTLHWALAALIVAALALGALVMVRIPTAIPRRSRRCAATRRAAR